LLLSLSLRRKDEERGESSVSRAATHSTGPGGGGEGISLPPLFLSQMPFSLMSAPLSLSSSPTRVKATGRREKRGREVGKEDISLERERTEGNALSSSLCTQINMFRGGREREREREMERGHLSR